MSRPVDPIVDGFERGTLGADAFRHREHLYVAWSYLRAMPFEEAAARFVHHLRRFAEAHGVANKVETPITWAYVALVAEARGDDDATFDALLARRPDLLERRLAYVPRARPAP